MFMKASTELRKLLRTWLRECCRQVQTEVISNSRSKLHQTTYKQTFSALYIQNWRVRVGRSQVSNDIGLFHFLTDCTHL